MKKLLAVLLTLSLLIGISSVALAETPGDTTIDGGPVVQEPSGTTNQMFMDKEDEDGTRKDDDKLDTNISNSISVTAIAKDQEPGEPIIYNVELIWGNMAFAWGNNDNESTQGDYVKIWNPETHTYTENPEVLSTTPSWYLISEDELQYNSRTITTKDKDGNDVTETKVSKFGGKKGQGTVLLFNHSNAEVFVEIAVEDIQALDYDVKLTKSDAVNNTPKYTADTNQKIVYRLERGEDVTGQTDAETIAGKIYKLQANAAAVTVEPSKSGDDNLGTSANPIATLTVKLHETDPSPVTTDQEQDENEQNN